MSQRSRVKDYIESKAVFLAEATADFIRTPSISGAEGEIARLLLKRMGEMGIEAKADAIGNVLGWVKGRAPADSKRLAFNVHLDHVPPGERASWKHDPYSGREEGGRVFGRGASDTKGAWAPMLLAMEAIERNGGVGGDVIFTAVVMEELTYCAGMRHLLEVTLKESRPDFIVSGEATSLNVAIGHRGRTEIEFVSKGRSAHASAPWRGENALYKAAHIISAMEKLSRGLVMGESHPLLGRSTLALTDIYCSPGAKNVIPDLCKVYMDYRFLPNENTDTILERIRQRMRMDSLDAEVRVVEGEEVSHTGYRFKGRKFMPGFIMDQGHPLVGAAVDSAKAVLASPPRIQRWDFATDGGYSMGVLGIPTIGLSPCEELMAHTVDECVRLDYMMLAAKIYAEMILRLCGGKEQ
jgi:putative selenium metabolism hydrolase